MQNVVDDVFGMQNNIMVDIECREENGVTFFNGIVVVKIMNTKKQKIKICLIFAKAVLLEKNSCTLVIFDRYTASSLKSYNRTTCRDGDSIQCKVHDKRKKILYLETKEFLTKSETERNSTKYLKTCKTNIDVNGDLFDYSKQ